MNRVSVRTSYCCMTPRSPKKSTLAPNSTGNGEKVSKTSVTNFENDNTVNLLFVFIYKPSHRSELT
jgi:hypothetical protein